MATTLRRDSNGYETWNSKQKKEADNRAAAKRATEVAKQVRRKK